nr:hypothetical protein [uncultured bacterium]
MDVMARGGGAESLPAVLAALLLCCGGGALSADAGKTPVAVDPDSTVAALDAAPLGLALNEAMDGHLPLETLIAAVKASGVKRLRFPEGEGADGYCWTAPGTFADPDPKTHRSMFPEWHAGWVPGMDAEGRYGMGLDFDRFIAVCEAAGCAPTVVLCYPGRDKAESLELAKAWVKYAKDRNCGVVDWEIGNETWLFNQEFTDLHPVTAAEYAKDAAAWSAALKAIDPGIRIGVNGRSGDWFRTLVEYRPAAPDAGGAPAFDFLVAHPYPMHGKPFAHYRDHPAMDLAPDVSAALAALDRAGESAGGARLRVAATEFGAMNYLKGNDPNNLGVAVATAEMALSILSRPRVDYAMLWNSRYHTNFTDAQPVAFDAFSKTNGLNPTGLALSVVCRFLNGKVRLVKAVSGKGTLRAFAAADGDGIVDILLVNRADAPETVEISVTGAVSAGPPRFHKHVFTGAGPSDFNPVFRPDGVSGAESAAVPPTSIVLLETPKSGK